MSLLAVSAVLIAMWWPHTVVSQENFFFLIEVWLICNIGLVSDAQRSDSVMSRTSQILFQCRLLQYIVPVAFNLHFAAEGTLAILSRPYLPSVHPV